jgi:hypothetical protein
MMEIISISNKEGMQKETIADIGIKTLVFKMPTDGTKPPTY